jgi:CHAD domain-containing protein
MHIEWDERAGVTMNCRKQLSPLVSAFFTRARDLLAKDPPPEQMHRLRLQAKRLRYTLELFRPCYGPGFESRLDALRKLQASLGDLNDAVATARLLSKDMKRSVQGARVQRYLHKRAAKHAEEFREHWTKVFDAPGQEAWWTGYLARNARKR